MLVLSRRDVESVLDLDRLVDAVADAMVDLSAGRVSMPHRVAAMVEHRHGLLAVMPAYLPAANALTAKLVSLFPENRDRPTHQAVICCFDADNGTPVAMIDGTYVTATRTAAGSALATRLLACRDASVLAIVGSGVQARAHAVAVVRVRDVERVMIAGRNDDAVLALVDELVALGIPAEAAATFEHAVRAADIVCATTHADQPVVRREWLHPGAHVNSVGYNTTGTGEVDAETIRDAIVVVESRDAVLAPPPSGPIEIRNAIEQGTITPDHIRAELGELVAGTVAGRTNDDEITLYKSVGVAVQDAAAATLVLQAARERGIGTDVDI